MRARASRWFFARCGCRELYELLPNNHGDDDGYDASINQHPTYHRSVAVHCGESPLTRINAERIPVDRRHRVAVALHSVEDNTCSSIAHRSSTRNGSWPKCA